MFFSYNAFAVSNNEYVDSFGTTTLMQEEQSIQSRIMDAFMNAYSDNNHTKLESIIGEISTSYEKSGNPIFLYWKGYALYYNSVAYLQNREAVNSAENLKEGIAALESIENKNSDDYALLAMLYNFSRLFLGYPKILEVIQNSNDCAAKALELNENNIRAYYVLAYNDMYVGGKNMEKYLLKALSLKKPETNNPLLPTWGREESYGLLTTHYINKRKYAKAKEYIDLGLQEFPNSYTLKENQSKLK